MNTCILIFVCLALSSCANLPRHEHLVGEIRKVGINNESLACFIMEILSRKHTVV